MTQLALDQKIAALRRFTRFFAQRLGALEAGPAGSPYSATEVRVLTELAQYEHRTVTALSRSLGLDAGYLSRVIRRLETTGIVIKTADSADNRQQPLSLTESGRTEVTTLDAITTARYASMVRMLPAHIHAPLLDAMERVEGAFGADVPGRDPAPWLLRPHRVGDISFVTQRMIASGLEEFEFTSAYEMALLDAASTFLTEFDAVRDCAWIAERDGAAVGSVLVRRADDASVAQLSMLHVESQARGIGIGGNSVKSGPKARRTSPCTAPISHTPAHTRTLASNICVFDHHIQRSAAAPSTVARIAAASRVASNDCGSTKPTRPPGRARRIASARNSAAASA